MSLVCIVLCAALPYFLIVFLSLVVSSLGCRMRPCCLPGRSLALRGLAPLGALVAS